MEELQRSLSLKATMISEMKRALPQSKLYDFAKQKQHSPVLLNGTMPYMFVARCVCACVCLLSLSSIRLSHSQEVPYQHLHRS